MILANGCNITKSEKFKGVWILSVPTVYLDKLVNQTLSSPYWLIIGYLVPIDFKLIYFSNSTQIEKLVYKINSMHTDWSSLCLWFF